MQERCVLVFVTIWWFYSTLRLLVCLFISSVLVGDAVVLLMKRRAQKRKSPGPCLTCSNGEDTS